MNDIFITGDHHFKHTNIIKYTNRPFSSVKEMDEVMIEKWNKKVGKNDIVYHLGDFCFCNYESDAKKYILKLNGKINLIKGDHDRWVHTGFRFPYKKEYEGGSSYDLLNTTIDNQQVTMCHWCMRIWKASHYNSWHLYAHSHNRLKAIGKSLDVGVDGHNFEPWSWEEIKEYMKDREDNFNFIKNRR